MKITRLRLEQVRQFRRPLELRDIDAGINLISGPNEAGKSTMVRAIRAAFFEKHRSMSVADLQPFGDSAAAPSIELDFHVAGIRYQLKKSFLQKKRADLMVGTDRLSNDDAETHLAELLGFAMSSRGASKAEQWGIPGLLWIEQGSGHEIHGAVGNASDHLRNALNSSLGEVTSTDGDDVLDLLKAERELLLTASTSRPTGVYKEVIEAMAGQQERLVALRQKIDDYREQVDRLGVVQAELAADDAARPWEAFEAQRQQAQAMLDGLAVAGRALDADRQALLQVEQKLQWLGEQARGFEQQSQQALQRRAEVEAANAAVVNAQERLAPSRTRLQAAEAALDDAQLIVAAARAELLRGTMATQLADWRSRHDAVERALAQARAHDAELAELRKVSIANQVDAVDLGNLQKIAAALRELEIRQQAVATRLSFVFEAGVKAFLDDESLETNGERLLSKPGELTIAGVGRLRIEPGGEDLGAMTSQKSRLEADRSLLLAKMGVADLAQAQGRQAVSQSVEQDMRRVQALSTQAAPKGVQALRLESVELQARIEALIVQQRTIEGPADGGTQVDADTSMDLFGFASPVHAAEASPDRSWTAPSESGPTPSLPEAERASTFAASQLKTAQAAAQDAQSSWVAARSRIAHAQAEWQAIDAILNLPERLDRIGANRAEQAMTVQQRDQLHAAVAAREAELVASQPSLLRQDVDRLGRSAEQALSAQSRRREEVLRLQSRLEEAGAQGLEDALAEAEAQAERSKRRHAELTLRAQALTLLVSLLEDKRRALTRRLQAPLQKHLDRHLQLLFPQAQVTLDEHLSPGLLTRGLPGRESETGDFHSLSFGAREQMALISRLAYADLLKEAGRPTLLILDDALVHSDATRLGQMKRILFDAATRHQVLLFTCHPDQWRDLGVPARSIDSMRVGPA
ncbi:MAG: double-strand break repair Rad50 ATPase [Rhizobacter sp.]|nr:double-strand break repair Rad50 ATPase [Rhizobacter sp.]